MRERRLLRCARVRQQRACGRHGDRNIVRAERCQVARTKLLRERAFRAGVVEMPCGERAQRRCGAAQRRRRHIFGQQQLSRLDALERRRGFVRRNFGDGQSTRRKAEPRDPASRFPADDRSENAVALRLEQIRFRHRSGRDDARNLAFERPLRRCRIAELLDDDHALAVLHQPREMLLDRMIRNARHRNRRARRLTARCERDVEKPCGAFVAIKQLVEIAHPIEHELVGMLRLDAPVLLHHRRVAGKIVLRR